MTAHAVLCAASILITVGSPENRQPSDELVQFMMGGAGRRRPRGQLDEASAAPAPTLARPLSTPPVNVARPDPAVRRFIGGGAQSSRRTLQPAVRTTQQEAFESHRQQDDDATDGNCDLRSVDAREITQSQFREQYQGREPLLLSHAATSWAATTTWATASQIAAAHGDVHVHLQDPVLLAKKGTFAPPLSTLSLADYLNSDFGTGQHPFFQNRWHSLTDRLLADVNFSHVPMRSVRSHHLFSLGGIGTGVGFHSHVESWLAQIQGRKHWSLARSLGPGWRVKHGCEWMSKEDRVRHNDDPTDYHQGADEPWYLELMGLRKRPLHQCVVHPGDAIYIPTGWYHATCSALFVLVCPRCNLPDNDDDCSLC